MRIIRFWRAAAAALCLTAPALVAAQTVETRTSSTTTTQTSAPEVVVPAPTTAPPPAPAYVYPATAPATTTTQTTTVVEEKSKDDYVGVHPGLEIGGRGMYFKPRGGPDSWSGGAQVRFHMTENWAVEGSADYRRVTLDTPAAGLTPAGSARVDVYPVQASLIGYLFPRSPITPFVLAGAGWYFTHASTPGGDRTDNRFGPHVGGGLQIFLGHHWSVDGTYRYVWIENFRSASTSLPENAYRDSGHMVTAALNYHF
jgi:opacity protein-like surface antigen